MLHIWEETTGSPWRQGVQMEWSQWETMQKDAHFSLYHSLDSSICASVAQHCPLLITALPLPQCVQRRVKISLYLPNNLSHDLRKSTTGEVSVSLIIQDILSCTTTKRLQKLKKIVKRDIFDTQVKHITKQGSFWFRRSETTTGLHSSFCFACINLFQTHWRLGMAIKMALLSK